MTLNVSTVTGTV